MSEETMEFDELAKDMHKENLILERKKNQSLSNQVELEFMLFRIWCKAFGEDVKNFDTFIKYRTNENVKINALIRKCIAEKFFNKIFIFDHKTNKWLITN